MARGSILFISIALLFFSTSTSAPVADTKLTSNLLSPLNVTGQICCTSTGNCPGQGVGGVVVSLNCTILGATITLGRATTNATGSFSISVPAVVGILGNLPILPCVVGATLPINNLVCPVLSTTNGLLVSAIRPITTILGLVRNATVTGFFTVGI